MIRLNVHASARPHNTGFLVDEHHRFFCVHLLGNRKRWHRSELKMLHDPQQPSVSLKLKKKRTPGEFVIVNGFLHAPGGADGKGNDFEVNLKGPVLALYLGSYRVEPWVHGSTELWHMVIFDGGIYDTAYVYEVE